MRILELGMPRYTNNTLLSPDAFFENMRSTLERGFAISDQEYEDGINAVAAPIFFGSNQPVGSISVAGPSYRFTRERVIEIGAMIVATAQEIAQEIQLVSHPISGASEFIQSNRGRS